MEKTARRQTIQKKLVWETIQSMHDHPRAEDVYLELHKKYENIGRATVFRILSDLAHDGKIVRVRAPYGADCYDYKTQHHWHIQCVKCGALVDIPAQEIEMMPSPTALNGFQVSGYTLVYEGLCPDCQKSCSKD
jgi:Fe2+ or Zn2+ uptake regulation protein